MIRQSYHFVCSFGCEGWGWSRDTPQHLICALKCTQTISYFIIVIFHHLQGISPLGVKISYFGFVFKLPGFFQGFSRFLHLEKIPFKSRWFSCCFYADFCVWIFHNHACWIYSWYNNFHWSKCIFFFFLLCSKPLNIISGQGQKKLNFYFFYNIEYISKQSKGCTYGKNKHVITIKLDNNEVERKTG